MAGYREHISVSGMLGVAYGVGATFAFGFTPDQGALAACVTWLAGMLPDLDSESGKPVREIFGIVAAITPLVLMQHLNEWGGNIDRVMLLSVGLYLGVRYGGALVLGKLSVHRGMFHSIPAMLIAAELTFLFYASPQVQVRLLMAAGVAVGFVSHLLLDELYSVQWTGVRIRLAKSAGSAMKLVGKNWMPNLFTYCLLSFLTYAILVNQGLLNAPGDESIPVELQQAVEDAPIYR